ncbi:MAG: fibronectin type III domain-containing protein [Clostridiales Family XIII bacterium]|jgi:predicted RNA-binding protein with TRAM domain|nr:fibronectin type III domain-containing protein [Clostridiales Family XIII bacterium]
MYTNKHQFSVSRNRGICFFITFVMVFGTLFSSGLWGSPIADRAHAAGHATRAGFVKFMGDDLNDNSTFTVTPESQLVGGKQVLNIKATFPQGSTDRKIKVQFNNALGLSTAPPGFKSDAAKQWVFDSSTIDDRYTGLFTGATWTPSAQFVTGNTSQTKVWLNTGTLEYTVADTVGALEMDILVGGSPSYYVTMNASPASNANPIEVTTTSSANSGAVIDSATVDNVTINANAGVSMGSGNDGNAIYASPGTNLSKTTTWYQYYGGGTGNTSGAAVKSLRFTMKVHNKYLKNIDISSGTPAANYTNMTKSSFTNGDWTYFTFTFTNLWLYNTVKFTATGTVKSAQELAALTPPVTTDPAPQVNWFLWAGPDNYNNGGNDSRTYVKTLDDREITTAGSTGYTHWNSTRLIVDPRTTGFLNLSVGTAAGTRVMPLQDSEWNKTPIILGYYGLANPTAATIPTTNTQRFTIDLAGTEKKAGVMGISLLTPGNRGIKDVNVTFMDNTVGTLAAKANAGSRVKLEPSDFGKANTNYFKTVVYSLDNSTAMPAAWQGWNTGGEMTHNAYAIQLYGKPLDSSGTAAYSTSVRLQDTALSRDNTVTENWTYSKVSTLEATKQLYYNNKVTHGGTIASNNTFTAGARFTNQTMTTSQGNEYMYNSNNTVYCLPVVRGQSWYLREGGLLDYELEQLPGVEYTSEEIQAIATARANLKVVWNGNTYTLANGKLTLERLKDNTGKPFYKVTAPDVLINGFNTNTTIAGMTEQGQNATLTFSFKVKDSIPTTVLKPTVLFQGSKSKETGDNRPYSTSIYGYGVADTFDVTGFGTGQNMGLSNQTTVNLTFASSANFNAKTSARLIDGANIGPWTTYNYSTGKTKIPLNPAAESEYKLTARNYAGAPVQVFSALIPIPKYNQTTGRMPANPNDFNPALHMQAAPFGWTASIKEPISPVAVGGNSTGYTVKYATTYETDPTNDAAFKLWQDIPNKNDIRMVRVENKNGSGKRVEIAEDTGADFIIKLNITDPAAEAHSGNANIYAAWITAQAASLDAAMPSQPVAMILKTGVIQGNVFNDTNKNGIKDISEIGRSGVTVKAYVHRATQNFAAGDLLETTTTDASGNYGFFGLDKAVVTDVRFENPGGADNSLRFSPVTAGGSTATNMPVAGENKTYGLTSNITPSADNAKTVHAGFIGSTTVNIEYNGGGTNKSLLRYPGESVTATDFGTPSKVGTSFEGWFKSATFDGEAITAPYVITAEDSSPTTFHAKYKDNVAPVTTINRENNEWIKGTDTIALSATDFDGTQSNTIGTYTTYYKISGGSQQTYEGNPFTLDQEGANTIEYWSVDAAGNVESHQTVTVNLDKTAPTSSLSKSAGSWVSPEDKLTISSVDAGGDNASGVDKIYYRFDHTGEFMEYDPETGIHLDSGLASGDHTVGFYAVDKAGNKEETNTVIIKLDKDLPVTTASHATDSWITGSTKITLSATNSQASGTTSTYYRIDGDAASAENFDGFSAYDSADGIVLGHGATPGKHVIYYYSRNGVGLKETVKHIDVKLDAVAPQSSISPVDGSWVAALSETPITLSAVDPNGADGSGVEKIFYKIDTSPLWIEYSGPFSLSTLLSSGPHAITFYAEDVAGNIEAEKTVTINLDYTLPTVSSSANTEHYYAESVETTLTASDAEPSKDGLTTIKYRFNSTGAWEEAPADGKVTIEAPASSGKVILNYRAYDSVGNSSTIGNAVFKFDVDAPQVSSSLATSESTYYKGNQQTTLTAADVGGAGMGHSGKIIYRIGEGAEQAIGASSGVASGSVTIPAPAVSGDVVLTYRAIDSIGNESAEQSIFYHFDQTGPTVESSLPEKNPDDMRDPDRGAYFSNQTTTLKAVDTESGVSSIHYKVGSGAEQVVNGHSTNVSIPAPAGVGNVVLEYWAEDNLGNLTSPHETVTYKFDMSVPTVNYSPSAAPYYNDDISTTIKGYSSASTITALHYEIIGGDGMHTFNDDQAHDITIPKPASTGTKAVKYKADIAGTEGDWQTVNYKFDLDAPTSSHGGYDGSAVYSANKVARIVGTDNGNGPEQSKVASIKYYFGSDSSKPLTASGSSANITVKKPDTSGDVKLTYWAVDGAGNEEAVKHEEIYHFDVDAPTVTSDLDDGGFYNETKVATLSASEPVGPNQSGVAHIYYSVNGGATTTVAAATGLATLSVPDSDRVVDLEYWADDEKGNTSTHITKHYNFEISLPEASISEQTQTYYNDDVRATITGINGSTLATNSGISSITYKIGSDEPVTKSGGDLVDGSYELTIPMPSATGNVNVQYWTKSGNGNVSTHGSELYRFDLTAPSVSSSLSESPYYKEAQLTTLTATDALAGVKNIKYQIGNGPVNTVSDATALVSIPAPVVSGDVELKMTSEDNLGNVSSEKVCTYKFDVEAPTTEPSLAWDGVFYNATKNIKLKATDVGGSSTKKISYKVGDATDWTVVNDSITGEIEIPAPVGQNGQVRIYYFAEDNSGNVEAEKSALYRFGILKPEISSSLTSGVFYSGNQVATLTAVSKNASAIDRILFIVNGGSTQTIQSSTAQVNIPEPSSSGEVTLEYWTVDKAGNTSAHHTDSYQYDEDAPSVDATMGGSPIPEKSYFNTSKLAKITATDGTQGAPGVSDIKSIHYTLDYTAAGGTLLSGEAAAKTASVDIEQPSISGKVVFTIWAEDKAGNLSQKKKYDLIFDEEVPNVEVNPDPSLWFKTAQDVEIQGIDNGVSGIAKVEYQLLDAAGAPGAVTVSDDHAVVHLDTSISSQRVRYRAQTKAGTWSSKTTSTFRFDNQAPTLTSSLDTAPLYSGIQKTRLTAVDPGDSGIKEFRYTITGKDTVIIYAGSKDYTDVIIEPPATGNTVEAEYEVVDFAGNISNKIQAVYNFDTAIPTITATAAPSGYVNTSQAVTLRAADDTGLDRIVYQINDENPVIVQNQGQGLSKEETITIPKPSASGDVVLRYWAFDKTDAKSIVGSNTYKFDVEVPNVAIDPEPTALKNGDIDVTIAATDVGGSGLGTDAITYKIDGGAAHTANGSGNNASATFTLAKPAQSGSKTVTYTAKDTAGNVSAEGSFTYKFDLDAPTVSVDLDTNTYGESPKTANITADDASGEFASGVKEIHYIRTGGLGTEAEQVIAAAEAEVNIAISGNGVVKLEYWVVDNSGNESAHDTKTYTFAFGNPVVNSVSPGSGGLVTLDGQNLVITFNKAMSQSGGTIEVKSSGGATATVGARTWTANNTVEAPLTGLANNTLYEVHISGFQDTRGAGDSEMFAVVGDTYTFRTVYNLNGTSPGAGGPDTNLVVDGNGLAIADPDPTDVPTVNIDTDGDGYPDTNVVVNGNGAAVAPTLGNVTPAVNVPKNVNLNIRPFKNVILDSDGNLLPPLDGRNKPVVNVDTAAISGGPDTNLVVGPDGLATEPTSTNYTPTVNISSRTSLSAGVGEADINLVVDASSGKVVAPTGGNHDAAVNVDTNDNRRPDKNVVVSADNGDFIAPTSGTPANNRPTVNLPNAQGKIYRNLIIEEGGISGYIGEPADGVYPDANIDNDLDGNPDVSLVVNPTTKLVIVPTNANHTPTVNLAGPRPERKALVNVVVDGNGNPQAPDNTYKNPTLNLSGTGDYAKKPVYNVVVDGSFNPVSPTQASHTPTVNVDQNKAKSPTFNIVLDATGNVAPPSSVDIPTVNLDTKNAVPVAADFNIVVNEFSGLPTTPTAENHIPTINLPLPGVAKTEASYKKAGVNVVIDGSGNQATPTAENHTPVLNIAVHPEDGSPAIVGGVYVPILNVVVDAATGNPDSVTSGHHAPFVNIDKNGDGYPDVNVVADQTTGAAQAPVISPSATYKPNVNLVLDPSVNGVNGKPSWNSPMRALATLADFYDDVNANIDNDQNGYPNTSIIVKIGKSDDAATITDRNGMYNEGAQINIEASAKAGSLNFRRWAPTYDVGGEVNDRDGFAGLEKSAKKTSFNVAPLAGVTVVASYDDLREPGVPQNLAVTPGNGEIKLEWQTPADLGNPALIDAYEVQIVDLTPEDDYTPPTAWTEVKDDTAFYFDTGLIEGHRYAMYVRAVNAAGKGEVAQKNSSPLARADAPIVDNAVLDGHQILNDVGGKVTISWNPLGYPDDSGDPSNGGAAVTRWQVKSVAAGTAPGNAGWTNIENPAQLTYTFEGLTNGTAYDFYVRANTNVGVGANSVKKTATPVGVATAPLSADYSVSNGSARVTWAAPANNGGEPIIGYSLRLIDEDVNVIETLPVGADVHEHDFNALHNGLGYTVEIKAVNSLGSSTAAIVGFTPENVSLPGAPTGLVATAAPTDGTKISLYWTAPADDGGKPITSYDVSYKKASENTWQAFSSSPATAPTQGSPLEITGLSKGEAYDFKVSARTSAGAGEAATESATTMGVPGAPTGLTATPYNASAMLNWAAPTSDGGSAITGYKVYYKRNSQNTYAQFGDIVNATSVLVTGLSASTDYDFKVVAVSIIGDGADSNVANARIPAAGEGGTPVSSVTITGGAATYKFKASGGNTMQHDVDVQPANADNKAVLWSSSDEKVAKVDATGLVTFMGKEGTVTITATSVADANKVHSKVITVTKNVTKVRAAMATVNVTVKKKVLLPVELDDGIATITGAPITYKSAKPAIAKVDAKGNVTGVKAGSTTVTVSSNGKSVKVKVVVGKKAVKLTKFALSGTPKKNKLDIGKTAQLKIKLTPAKASDLKVTFKSSKPKIASVDKAGKITGLTEGKAKITVKVGKKTVKTKDIQVQAPVKKLTVASKKLDLKKGKTATIAVTPVLATALNPNGAAIKAGITFTTSNKKIVSVDKKGKIKGVKVGKATITAKSLNGKSVKITVNVKK